MKAVQLFILAFLLSALALVLPGCTTAKKFVKYGKDHPDIAAQFCADEYPAKDSVIKGKSDTITQTQVRLDTVTTTIINEVTGATRTIKLPCPPCKSTTHTITVTDTIVRVDRAVEKLKDLAESELAQTKKEYNSLRWFALGAVLAAIVLLVLLLKK